MQYLNQSTISTDLHTEFPETQPKGPVAIASDNPKYPIKVGIRLLFKCMTACRQQQAFILQDLQRNITPPEASSGYDTVTEDCKLSTLAVQVVLVSVCLSVCKFKQFDSW